MKWREGPKSGSGVGSDWPSGREDFTEKVQAMSILGGKVSLVVRTASAKALRQKHA